MNKLVAVNVGLPQDIQWRGKTVRTAIWKRPVEGPVFAGRTNLAGDAQADLRGHGGEQRAVLVYQLASYRYWAEYLGRSEFEHGQFGENLTVDGLADDEVCIGDRYRIGDAVFEVSQPRVTCYRLAIRMDCAELPGLLVSHGRPGFYMRVIEEGNIAAGDEIIKIGSGPERMTVRQIDALLYQGKHPVDQLTRALRISPLSPGWKGSFEALLQAADGEETESNAGLTASSGGPPAWPGFRPLRVEAIHQESEDVKSLFLAAPDGSALPLPRPGQHVAIKVLRESEGSRLTRMYSISGVPQAHAYRISVKREGAASDWLHKSTRVGDLIETSAPRGAFMLKPGSGPVVLMSAGIGITPVMALLHSLAASAATSSREVWWLHGARDGRHHPFREEVGKLLRKLRTARSYVAFSQASPQDRLDRDFDVQGRLDTQLLERLRPPTSADFYLCGPSTFLADMELALRQLGVAASRINTEVFGVSADIANDSHTGQRTVHAPPGEPGSGPLVTFVRSGLSVRWDDRFASLLELSEACDVRAQWSCRAGVCHLCESGLIDGEVRYSSPPLDLPSRGQVLICCSKPSSDIQLDL
jgi:ferredoxin-NADP reductase/MOSC domain-containing protein YiiM/ferredoxin